MDFKFKLEDVKYVKVLCKNANGEARVVKLALKNINDREIISTAKYDETLDIPAFQEVLLTCVCKDGVYETETRLKSVEKDEPYMVFVFEIPQDFNYVQNREFFRVPVNYKCIFKIVENNMIKEFEAQTIDISANGISILFPMHVVTEKFSDISILINGRLVQAKISYIRSEEVANGYKVSFTFIKIADTDRDYLSQICIQKQLEERRNSLR